MISTKICALDPDLRSLPSIKALRKYFRVRHRPQCTVVLVLRKYNLAQLSFVEGFEEVQHIFNLHVLKNSTGQPLEYPVSRRFTLFRPYNSHAYYILVSHAQGSQRSNRWLKRSELVQYEAIRTAHGLVQLVQAKKSNTFVPPSMVPTIVGGSNSSDS